MGRESASGLTRVSDPKVVWVAITTGKTYGHPTVAHSASIANQRSESGGLKVKTSFALSTAAILLAESSVIDRLPLTNSDKTDSLTSARLAISYRLSSLPRIAARRSSTKLPGCLRDFVFAVDFFAVGTAFGFFLLI